MTLFYAFLVSFLLAASVVLIYQWETIFKNGAPRE